MNKIDFYMFCLLYNYHNIDNLNYIATNVDINISCSCCYFQKENKKSIYDIEVEGFEHTIEWYTYY